MPRVCFTTPHEGMITVGGGGVAVEFVDGYADAPETAWESWQALGLPIEVVPETGDPSPPPIRRGPDRAHKRRSPA